MRTGGLTGTPSHSVQGFVLLMAALYIAVNLALDIATTLLDPRVSHDV
jgi:ABC-type dipeptide/oligopeptide/nickel transport system permease component